MLWQIVDKWKKCQNKRCRWGKITFVVVVGICVIYTICWFVLAYIVQNRAFVEIQQIKARGDVFSCNDLRKTGYPLWIGLNCAGLRWEDSAHTLAITAQNLVATSPLYAPHNYAVEVQSPAHLHFGPGQFLEHLSDAIKTRSDLVEERVIDAGWDGLNLYAAFDDKGVSEADLIAKNVRLQHTLGTEFKFLFDQLDFIRINLVRQTEELGINLFFDEFKTSQRLEKEGEVLPPLSGEISLVMNSWRDVLIQPESIDGLSRLRGQSGYLQRASLYFVSGGMLEGQGHFRFSPEGLLSGEFSVAIKDMPALQRSLRPLLPSQVSNFETIFFALSTMPKNADGDPIVTISIDEGKLQLGFFSLGQIPPL